MDHGNYIINNNIIMRKLKKKELGDTDVVSGLVILSIVQSFNTSNLLDSLDTFEIYSAK
jgi:hypothetical protein